MFCVLIMRSCPWCRSVKKKKSKKSHKRPKDDAAAAAGDTIPEEPIGDEEPDAVHVKGSGRITSSGMVVHGVGTTFMHDFRPGDGIQICHPTSYATVSHTYSASNALMVMLLWTIPQAC